MARVTSAWGAKQVGVVLSSIGSALHRAPHERAAAWRVAAALHRHGAVPALLDVLRCPIGNARLVDPVVAADGHTYERVAIETCFRAYPRSTLSPATGEVLASHAPERACFRFLFPCGLPCEHALRQFNVLREPTNCTAEPTEASCTKPS